MSRISKCITILLLTSWCFRQTAPGQDCTKTSVGLKPLTELGTGSHKGYQGGLYPNGSNQRPFAHDSAGLHISRQIRPLDGNGTPDPVRGKMVLLSIGMSNTTQEFSRFKSIADADRDKNTQVAIVDGAQGGQTAAIISNPGATFWTTIDQRLTNAGVTRQQVQIAWVKEADAGPTQAFPTHAVTLRSELEAIARNLKSKYPNIKIAYWSSRTYGGYATTSLNPEPYAYESGFSVKWLIEKQINGDTSLAYSGLNVRAPWLAWGPYLWADGMIPRSDGFFWQCRDFTSDGTHPDTSGRTKVAQLLLTFLKTDPTTKSWFLRSSTSVGQGKPSTAALFSLQQNYPNPFNPTTTIVFHLPTSQSIRLTVLDVLGREIATLIDGDLVTGYHQARFDGSPLPSGVYFYRLTAGDRSLRRAMVYLR